MGEKKRKKKKKKKIKPIAKIKKTCSIQPKPSSFSMQIRTLSSGGCWRCTSSVSFFFLSLLSRYTRLQPPSRSSRSPWYIIWRLRMSARCYIAAASAVMSSPPTTAYISTPHRTMYACGGIEKKKKTKGYTHRQNCRHLFREEPKKKRRKTISQHNQSCNIWKISGQFVTIYTFAMFRTSRVFLLLNNQPCGCTFLLKRQSESYRR